jgi:putative methanogenesis marker protein 17
MLKIFWEKFGKEHVEQPDRFTVMLYDVKTDPRAIEEIAVADPSESLFRDLIYALRCIAPEGFRLRIEKFDRAKFAFIASENTLAMDTDALVAEQFARMGEKP